MLTLIRNGTHVSIGVDDGPELFGMDQKTFSRMINEQTGRYYDRLVAYCTETNLPIEDTLADLAYQSDNGHNKWYDILTTTLKDRHHLLYFDYSDMWYEYETRGVYTRVTKTTIKSYIKAYIDETRGLTIDKLTKAMEMLSIACEHQIEELNNYHGLINCRNGILNTHTFTLIPHSPDYLFTYQYQIEYTGADLPTPYWDRLCSETTPDADYCKIWMHDLFTNNRSNEFMLWIVGPTNSGASTFMNLIEHIVDTNGVSKTPLNTLGGTFGLQNIIGCILNCDDDITEGSFKANTMSIYKKLMDCNASIDVNMKNKAQITLDWKGFMLGSSNNLPTFPKNVDIRAIFKRVCFARFPHTFANDPDFQTHLYAEASAIFSKVIRMAHVNVKEDVDAWIARNRTIYDNNGSPKLQFLSNLIEYSESPVDFVGIDRVMTMIARNFGDTNPNSIKTECRFLLMKLGGITNTSMVPHTEVFIHLRWNRPIQELPR